jgi:hypothetical protein
VNPTNQRLIIAAGEVCPTDAAGKKDVSAEQQVMFRQVKADASRAVPWDMKDPEI